MNSNSSSSLEQFHGNSGQGQNGVSKKRYMPLLLINYTCLFVGSVSSSLLSKYYFNHKGSNKWVSTWVQSAGFPFLLFPVFLPYYLFQCTTRKPFTRFSSGILSLSIFIGLMLGLNNLLFSWGNSYLPVSTSALLLSSQLVFNLILSTIIVKQKITFMNLNCVILLTLSSILLALGSSHDRPQDLTPAKYFLGFVATIGAGLLFALYLPIMEVIYKKVYCFAMVVEMQLVMEVSATLLASVGMAWDGGFAEMIRESREVFDKGERVYWATVVTNVVTWQLCFMGTAGTVFLSCSLTGGICMTALLGINVFGGVLVYREDFSWVKAVSTVMCGWGFCSYVYGMYVNKHMIKHSEDHKQNNDQATEMAQPQPQAVTPPSDHHLGLGV